MNIAERKAVLRHFLEEKRALLLDALGHIHDEDWNRKVQTSGDEWTALHMIRHLQDAHVGLTRQTQRLLAGEQTVPRDFDINSWNARIQHKTTRAEMSPEEALKQLKQSHENLLHLVESIQDEDWDKTGWSAALQQEVDLETFLHVIGEHEARHAADFSAAFGRG